MSVVTQTLTVKIKIPDVHILPLTLFYTNVRSICSNDKRDCLLSHIDDCDADIVALTETWLTPHKSNDEIFANSSFVYEIFRCDRAQRIGGGVLLAVRPCLKPVVINLSVADLEMVWISFRSTNNNFVVGVCYRPPDSSPSFVSSFHDALNEIAVKFPSSLVYIVGDFNFPDIVWDPLPVSRAHNKTCDDFIRVASLFNLSQLILQPTRIGHTRSSILDLLFTTQYCSLYTVVSRR